MSRESIDRIITELYQEESKLNDARGEMQKRIDIVDAELRKVRAGILALSGKPNAKGKKSKLSPNKAVVRDALYRCLNSNKLASLDELKTAIGSDLAQSGYSRMGLALRIREVIKEDESVRQTREGFRLVSTQVSEGQLSNSST